MQALLAMAIGSQARNWNVEVTTGQRMQVSPHRVRIPDLALVRPGALSEDVLTVPPLCVIEILSPDDTYAKTGEKAQDYRRMGIENIWLIDPATRCGQASTPTGWQDTLQLTIPATPICLNLIEIFSRLDESRKA